MKHTPKIIIKCTLCGVQLSPILQQLPKDIALNFKEKEALLPQGYFTFYNEIQKRWAGLFPKETTPKSMVINRHDLLHTKDHIKKERISGCCGLSGGLPNKMCVNNHEIATEFSDCIMAHCVIFEENQVEIISNEPLKGRKHSEIEILELASAYQKQLKLSENPIFGAVFYEVSGGKNYWIVQHNFDFCGEEKEYFYMISDQTGELLQTMCEWDFWEYPLQKHNIQYKKDIK